MYNSFTYIIFNDGIDTTASYHYQGKVNTLPIEHSTLHHFSAHVQQHTCNFTSANVGATMSGIIAISSGNEKDLQAAVTYSGPVTAAVDARRSGFRVSEDKTIHLIIITKTVFHF